MYEVGLAELLSTGGLWQHGSGGADYLVPADAATQAGGHQIVHVVGARRGKNSDGAQTWPSVFHN